MKDIENNFGQVFDEITVVESSNLNIITSNSLSLFGLSGQVLIRAAPSTVNYAMTLPNSIGTAGQLLSTDGLGNAYWVTAGGGGGGTGTVTSISITVPSILSVSGSPITSSGTIAITTAQTPSGSGPIVLNFKPTITNPTIKIDNNVGIFAVDFTTPIGVLSEHLFGVSFNDGEFVKISTFKNAAPSLSTTKIGNNSSYITFNNVGIDITSAYMNIYSPLTAQDDMLIQGDLRINSLSEDKIISTDGSKTLVSVNSTGTGDVVRKTTPSIVNPTVLAQLVSSEYLGVNALDPSVPSDELYTHYFGRDTFDSRNNLKISTYSDTTFKYAFIQNGQMSLNFNNYITSNRLELDLYLDSDAKILLTKNTSTNISKFKITSDTLVVDDTLSDATKPSLLITNRVSSESQVQKVTAGTTGQVLAVQGDGSIAFSTPGVGGTVTSVGVSVPAILSVSGSPITTSGTIAITTATTPTGSGAIVLKTTPSITNPTITSSSNLGINALDSTIPLGQFNNHYFGIDTSDTPNYLKISTLSSDEFVYDRYSSISSGTDATIKLGRNQGAKYIKLGNSDTTEIHFQAIFSEPNKDSLLITQYEPTLDVAYLQKITTGTEGQVPTVQSDGTIAFSTPTVGTVTSVEVSVPSILSVSGSPITSSGTIAITTATTPTGSGAIVLQTAPSITNPTITSSANLGINALDSTITLGEFNNHYFGIDTSDTRNYLKISALSSDSTFDDRYSSISSADSTIKLGNYTGVKYIKIGDTTSTEIHFDQDKYGSTTKDCLLLTKYDGVIDVAIMNKLEAGTEGQVPTTQSDGTIAFAAPSYTTQSTTLKSKNTTYQNTSKKPLMVLMNYNTSVANEVLTIKCDTNSTPSTNIYNATLYVLDYPVTFIVLPSYYYRITSSAGGSIIGWTEWN
jgi:hypothetical protein